MKDWKVNVAYISSPNLSLWVDLVVPNSSLACCLWFMAPFHTSVEQPCNNTWPDVSIIAPWCSKNYSNTGVMMCNEYMKHTESGFGSRSVSARCCSPASGSAEQHLPSPHQSAPLHCGSSTGDARRLKAQLRLCEHRRLPQVDFPLEKKKQDNMLCSSPSASWFSRSVFAFGLSSHVISRDAVGALGSMRITVGCRGWWCPTMNAGWFFVFFLSGQESRNQSLNVLRFKWWQRECLCVKGGGDVNECNWFILSENIFIYFTTNWYAKWCSQL